MGNNNDSKSLLQKGEGLRILSIKLNCPFDGKVEPFFDFIIDIIPLEPQRSTKQILEKLTDPTIKKDNSNIKDFNEIILQNQDRKLQMKIVSTKLRNARSVIITPNRNWNGSQDLIGIKTRKEKYHQAYNTYFPITQIQHNSPIQLSGANEGEYIIGCLEFSYTNLNQLIEGLYDRFFDKEVHDKNVHLAFYAILEDEVSIRPVLLKRKWGKSGLLGCSFLQGQFHKFPSNLKEKRQAIYNQIKINQQRQKIKHQIEDCNGASKTLAQALMKKRSKKGKHMHNLRNMTIPFSNTIQESKSFDMIEKPEHINKKQEIQSQLKDNKDLEIQSQLKDNKDPEIQSQLKDNKDPMCDRIKTLQNKIDFLEKILMNAQQYLGQMNLQEQEQQESIQNLRVIKG